MMTPPAVMTPPGLFDERVAGRDVGQKRRSMRSGRDRSSHAEREDGTGHQRSKAHENLLGSFVLTPARAARVKTLSLLAPECRMNGIMRKMNMSFGMNSWSGK
jgi:hypothetical protein